MRAKINQILERNVRVEIDKAWETSKTRRVIITAATYLVAVLFLFLIQTPKPWLTALVPTGGFVLSTLTLPVFKRWWVAHIYNKSKKKS